jgi:hypothetical protein
MKIFERIRKLENIPVEAFVSKAYMKKNGLNFLILIII